MIAIIVEVFRRLLAPSYLRAPTVSAPGSPLLRLAFASLQIPHPSRFTVPGWQRYDARGLPPSGQHGGDRHQKIDRIDIPGGLVRSFEGRSEGFQAS